MADETAVVEPIAVPDATGDSTPADAPHTPEATQDEFSPLESIMAEYDKPGEVQQTEAPAPDLSQYLTASPYVTTAEQIPNALAAATEVWDVATGKQPAYTLLQAMERQDPARHQAMVGELTQYIEHVTGKKLGGEQAVDPVAQLRTEMQQERVRQQQERQQYETQQQIQKATAVTQTKVAEMLKGTILEGQGDWLIGQVSQHLQVTPQQLLQEVVGGNLKNLEAAISAASKAEQQRIAAINKQIIAQHRAKKGALPASKGNSAIALPTGKDAPDLSTPEARIAWATEQFKAR